MGTDIRWNGDGPHGNSCCSSGENDGAEVELRRVRPFGGHSLLDDFVSDKVPKESLAHLNLVSLVVEGWGWKT